MKKETLLGLLDRGTTMLHLDATRPGVVVPEQHEGDHHLRLNLSYRYRIPDLEIDDQGVRATLSFGGRGHHCTIPWGAVFAATQGEDGLVWAEDVPATVTEEVAEKKHAPKRPASAPKKRSTELKVLAGGTEQTPPKNGHLRLVRN